MKVRYRIFTFMHLVMMLIPNADKKYLKMELPLLMILFIVTIQENQKVSKEFSAMVYMIHPPVQDTILQPEDFP